MKIRKINIYQIIGILTLFIIGVVSSCSKPVTLPGTTDTIYVTNVITNEVPGNGGNTGGDNGNGDNNGNGGDNGNGGGNNGNGDGNNGGITPPTPDPDPQPTYAGVAKRIPNKELVGNKLVGEYKTAEGILFRRYELLIHADGSIEYWIKTSMGTDRYWAHKVGVDKDNDINDSNLPVTKFRFVGYCNETRRFMLVEVIFENNYTRTKIAGTREAIYDFFIQQNQEWWYDQYLTVQK